MTAGIATPVPPSIMLVVNELFREYLQESGMHNTLAVFLQESGTLAHVDTEGEAEPPMPGQTRPVLSRKLMEQELGLRMSPHCANRPLVYGIVQYLRERTPAQVRGEAHKQRQQQGAQQQQQQQQPRSQGEEQGTDSERAAVFEAEAAARMQHAQDRGFLAPGYPNLVDVAVTQERAAARPLHFSS